MAPNTQSTAPVSPHKPVVIGISQGDINGIGLEVIIKTFADPAMLELCTPVLYSSAKTVSFHKKTLQMEHFNYNTITTPEGITPRKFNLANIYSEEVNIEFGRLTDIGGQYAIKSFIAACDSLSKGRVDAIVTAPINKNNTHSEAFPYAGHTSYLDERFGKGMSLMMLVSGDLKVALCTEHIPVASVAGTITKERILRKLRILANSLKQDFSINKPKIAVLGLNPHAGDSGTIGGEEKDIIAPAVKAAMDEGMLAYGPYPADGFFGSMMFKKFDAVLAMYHDQGLVPFKYIAFDSGVNYTAGLPIIRTSPDHGTAFDIAGKNMANEESFRNAVYLAVDLVRTRRNYKQATANPLKAVAINMNQRDE
ncbi:MAG TPA: 4-hydroxythreonine-4-phosphate dehydrogenase PdxA [Bacteroidia bacterium]|nr:4-hydroxythreonine-4-phosphate dehydrogenase PdxA [Bacteroidia bacterium]